MKLPLQVGVTGGIGSGKSLVCKIFECLGAPVYNADTRARELMTGDAKLAEEIRREFGAEAYLINGNLNRPYVAQKVFGNPEQLNRLNRLVHPRVGEDYLQWRDGFKNQTYVVREAALIFESNVSKGLDIVVVVSAPEDLRIKRVLERDTHRTEREIREIIGSQMSEEEKLKRADSIIINDESQLIIPQVLLLHRQFNERPQGGVDFKS